MTLDEIANGVREGLLPAARRFADIIQGLTEAIGQFAEALNRISDFKTPDIQPAVLYRMWGSPYGKNRKGKKRWLLEMKQRSRQRDF